MRVMVVDDHEIVREGLLTMLAADPWLNAVGAAANGREALELARRVHPEVALVDLRLPDTTGYDLCRDLLHVLPKLKVVVLTTYLGEEAVRNALRAGAAGYVTKAAGIRKLREVLAALAVDSTAVARPHEASQIVKQLHDLVSQREGDSQLTPQQERVVELAAQGLTNRAIGERMFISESTVRFHVQKLKERLGARTRTELIAKAIRLGMIPPAPEPVAAPLSGPTLVP